MSDVHLSIEEGSDPVKEDRIRAQFQRGRRNSQWLAAHWHEILPDARGRFVAVAGEEAFVADNSDEAWACAKHAHPDDDGAFVQYVFPTCGLRLYANRRVLAGL